MKKLVFGRISLTKLIEDQEYLINNFDKMKKDEIVYYYNRATLGLVPEFNPLINYLFLVHFDREVIKRILPIIFRKVLRRALRYRSEVDKYREIPEYEIDF